MEQKDNLALERDIAKRLHAIGLGSGRPGYAAGLLWLYRFQHDGIPY